MAAPEIAVLIPESTRKRKGNLPNATPADTIADSLPTGMRAKLQALRDEISAKSPEGTIDLRGLMPAFHRFDGNMYRYIPDDAWANRSPKVEVVIASGFRGLLASRDTVPAYALSMAEATPPFGKLNRWWHERGLPEILASYLAATKPKTVVDLLSLEYRESVVGYADLVSGMAVRTIDFPGMGRASQPLRGERVAEILQSGKA